jgi:xanthine dehydrogenase small subunit
MSLIINDKNHEVAASSDMPLLDFLRGAPGLRAAKPACGTGDCGACLVLLGEIPPEGASPVYRVVNSCLLTLEQADGCQVITAEGLNGEGLNAVQTALAEHGGVQCGYCTPGLVVAMTGALLQGEKLTEAVSGNLCRCTGYAGIRRACEAIETRFGTASRTPDILSACGLMPSSVAMAARALRPLPSESLFPVANAVCRAGDTDQAVRQRHLQPDALPHVRLHRVPALRTLTVDERQFRIGAALTLHELQHDPQLQQEWPALTTALLRFASPSIRQMATIGGNLVNASPVADMAVLLLAMSAELVLATVSGERVVPLNGFYTGYHTTILQPSEVLTRIQIPRNPDGLTRLHFEKVAHRELDDIATVNTALAVDDGLPGCFGLIRAAAGGVAPFPLRLPRFESALSGQPIRAAEVRQALSAVVADITPVDDVRGSAVYKQRLLQHLLVSHLIALYPELPFAECLP